MAVKYGFYNSVSGDRVYDAEDFSEFFDGIVSDGVVKSVGSSFDVTANGTSITLGSGRAWFNKTWTYNDGDISIPLPPPSGVNNRLDLLVLEVDKTIANRQNRFFILEGTPATNPVQPTLIRTEQVNQYAIASIYRTRDVTTVNQNNITSLVGTGWCPWAANVLTPIEVYDTLSYKRSVFRGNNLGSVMTAAQKKAVRDGTFEDLYLGDYWVHTDGVKYRIVDFDYYLGRPNAGNPTPTSPVVTEHHIAIMPDGPSPTFGGQQMSPSAPPLNKLGYANHGIYHTFLQNFVNSTVSIWGPNTFLANWRPYAIEAVPSWRGMSTHAYKLYYVSAPSAQQLQGYDGEGFFESRDYDTAQFALFRLRPDMIKGVNRDGVPINYWTRTCCGTQSYLIGRHEGNIGRDLINSWHHSRPVFHVTGRV